MSDQFIVKLFAEELSLLVLDSILKIELLTIVQHYKLSSIMGSLKKGEIKKPIKEYLIDEDLVPE